MKRIVVIVASYLLLNAATLHAQPISLSTTSLHPVGVSLSSEKLNGKQAIKVIKDSTIKEVDEPTFVKIKDIDFKNGTIEVKVLSRLLKTAPEYARGFIGIAFRINDNNSKFECIYLRPTNGRADNQLRRNRSIQYFSYPDHKFDRLRKEAPGEYETYADMALNEWITMRIVVKNNQAKLYLNNNKQPSLVVNDLKHGPDSSGSIGLWVDIGTEGYFSELKISKAQNR